MATISHIFHIDATREEVMQAISTIDGLKKWWTVKTSGDEKPGGVLEFNFSPGAYIKFRVEQINGVEGYHWECTDAHPEWIGTKARFELSRSENKTKVEFHHSGWAEQSEFFARCNFSWGRYFISLRDYLETGTGNPFIG